MRFVPGVLRPRVVLIAVTAVALCPTAAHAAGTLSLSQVTPAPTAKRLVTIAENGTTDQSPGVLNVFYEFQGTACAPTGGEERMKPNAQSLDVEYPPAGSFSFQGTFIPNDPGAYVICGYIGSFFSDTDAAAVLVVTVSAAGSGPGPGTTPGGSDTTGPTVVIGGPSSVKVSKTGTLRIPLSCPAEVVCSGTVRLAARMGGGFQKLGATTFKVGQGHTAHPKFTLSAANRGLLARVHKLNAKVTVVARDLTGNAQTTTKALTLRAP